MRKKPIYFQALVLTIAAVFFISCSKDDDETPKYTVTQADLDAVKTFLLEKTGEAFPHGPPPTEFTGDSTIRFMYANKDLSGDIAVGTIVTKKTWHKGPDGKKTDKLYASFAMVKREAGYNPDGGDWEYVKMPNDGSTDYTKNPNGVLPAAESENRGKLGCNGCHSDAKNNDFLFVND